ncbi:MAG: hypothetical protein SFY69_00965 [Planctomycetota bacterium]|nr:hypothetical protein [Planctomycetota bacterium]
MRQNQGWSSVWIVPVCVVGLLGAGGAGPLPEGQAPVRELLSQSTWSVSINGQRILVDAAAWRDFMPPTGESRSPCFLNITLRPQEGETLPAGLSVRSVVMRQGRFTWRPTMVRVDALSIGGGAQVFYAGGGPPFFTGTTASLRFEVATPRASARAEVPVRVGATY